MGVEQPASEGIRLVIRYRAAGLTAVYRKPSTFTLHGQLGRPSAELPVNDRIGFRQRI